MQSEKCVGILNENLGEYKKQILTGVVVGALMIVLINIASWVLRTPIPLTIPTIIIGTFITGYLISKIINDIKAVAVSGFITYLLISMFIVVMDTLNVLTHEITFPSSSTLIIQEFIHIIFIIPLFSLVYGIPSALSGYLIQRKENLKLAAAGGLIFPLIFTIIVLLAPLLFPERNPLSFDGIHFVILGNLFVVAATGIVFSSIFPLFKEVISSHNKISKIIFSGIVISALIALSTIIVVLLSFNIFALVVGAVLLSCLYLLILKIWKNQDTLKITLLLGIGLASFKIIPSSISFVVIYLLEGYTFVEMGMPMYSFYIYRLTIALTFLISPPIVVLAANRFRETLKAILLQQNEVSRE